MASASNRATLHSNHENLCRTKILNLLNPHPYHVDLKMLQDQQIVDDDLNDFRLENRTADLNLFLCQLRPLLGEERSNMYKHEPIQRDIRRIDEELRILENRPLQSPAAQTPVAAPAAPAQAIQVLQAAHAAAPQNPPAPAPVAVPAAPVPAIQVPQAGHKPADVTPKPVSKPKRNPIAAFFSGIAGRITSLWHGPSLFLERTPRLT